MPVDIVLKIQDALLLETARYNARIWCHYIGWDLKIFIDDLDKYEFDCTWGECCTKVCKRIASVGIVNITNSEKNCKWHALFRILERFHLLSK